MMSVHYWAGTKSVFGDRRSPAGNGVDRRRRLASQRVGRGIHESVRETSLCDIAVMLHLRACYVSKAAILTMPIQSVSVRKSKSRLNSKGLDR
jgi:hypothetical protein